ncbi:MAG TPA: DUF1266 domain-containing protein [Actinophytocola sp.]|uniref:DUF1266 domain-containing protein n=1 Tax=Actinophytocola sp. TaxID=1872138 RepID=UPI002DBA36B7|nr:DUF1266 domain-containing protein [Actinophytocola sp.]HEU5475921.1 DUF1266 domain-containing protein [Actinophytocola sp.]
MSSCGHVDTLVSAPRGPFFGPLAHGFACGAHIPIHSAQAWNALIDPAAACQETRDSLQDSWGISTADEWREHVDRLLAGEDDGQDTDLLLQLRRDVIARAGRCDLPAWRAAIRQWGQWRSAAPEVVDGFTVSAGVIIRYEARFRADGLLPPDGMVSSVRGYDYGRAVNMARWGFGGRFCDYRAAESTVLRAGELVRQRYTSWADYGGGYALGRVLRFDNEEYGHTYQSVLGPNRMLLTEQASPWLHIPFS